jgi:hypothetical protein
MDPPDSTAPQTPVVSGAEPPAVVSLLAGHLDDTGYPATLLDLAARGWFRLAEPEPGRLMCLLPPDPPRQPLAPYEERAALHLARRAAGRGEVPASALAEGFADGQVAFSESFHDEVVEDARGRGLIRPRLRGRTALLLAGAALIPAVLVAGAVHVTAHPGRAFLPVLCWLVLLWFIGLGLRGSERLTEAGTACLAGWQRSQTALTGDGPRAAVPGVDPGTGPAVAGDDLAIALDTTDGDRTIAYAAALGAAPAVVAAFTRTPTLVWSSYGGRWRQLAVGDPAERSWLPGVALALFGGLTTSFFAALLLIGGLVVHGFDGAVLVAAGVAGVVGGVVLLRRAKLADEQLPSIAEFDGVALERWTWVQKGDEGSDTTCYAVALDDGQQDQAWAFTVDHGVYARLVPGTLVHATVNPRRNRLVAADVTGIPQLPPHVAGAQAARQPLRARLIKADEAARVLGVPHKEVQCYLLGVSCIWKRAKGRGSITITAGRRAMLARHAERNGRPLAYLDGVERWLVGDRSVVLRRGTMVVKIILSGHLGLDQAEALAWLTDLATERLAAAPGDEALSEDEWTPRPDR